MLNRSISIVTNNNKTVVHLDAKPNQGVSWIKKVTFKTGTIEFDVKGKDVLQESFVGIAFHNANDSAFDVVYFRPFNFNSPDTVRKNHSVQYISLPKYDWPFLREKFTGKYENKLTKSIDPESWFHAKVIVTTKLISVYVDDDKTPSLQIKPLTNNSNGNIGFWVGNGSDGDFANLTISK